MFFDYIYDIDLSQVANNYYKEILYHDSDLIDMVKLYSIGGSVLGIIEYNYSKDGKINEVNWYLGNKSEKVRSVSRISDNINLEITESPES